MILVTTTTIIILVTTTAITLATTICTTTTTSTTISRLSSPPLPALLVLPFPASPPPIALPLSPNVSPLIGGVLFQSPPPPPRPLPPGPCPSVATITATPNFIPTASATALTVGWLAARSPPCAAAASWKDW
eukprot:CAMPEP_0175073264 /NCGR_PEP_ID=MMETSP0052_2-20121109/20434_1 /TAXON_ID=51329 ORGANISM="Polytomella parva, Strain SAG 63-3" /NCGR_SAMPLE_ID=MMETSP0052_2 /ASSEMBLY_ACC=CAM_ASM_000194 /LENGTH=131 /DNA_ID=CAMNT_0016340991 /DNA_START=54 /DNA_END=446 /DNA_ORIENTATION=-